MKNMFIPVLTGIVLFVYGLNIPRVSMYLLLVAIVALFFASWFKAEYQKAFMDRLLLLVPFAVSYYLFTTIHGITGIKEAILNVMVIIGSYALGFLLASGSDREIDREVPLVLFLMAAGFITFSFLSVYSFLQTSGLVEIVERSAASFWDGSEINAPGLGANASLGMCLLPLIFYGRDADCKGVLYSVGALSIALMFAAGVYVNVALQNRAPFIATAASLLCGTLVYLHKHRTDLAKVMRRMAIIGLLAGTAVYYLATSVDLTQFELFTRFTEERLGSLRYEAWRTMLSSLHHSLLGGRVVRLGEDLNFVHNLWLDVIWDAGIVPVIFLVAFHLKHLHCFKRILQSKLPLFVVLVISGLGTSVFITFMLEPTLSASVPYFAASCFFLGLVLRMSQNLESREDTP